VQPGGWPADHLCTKTSIECEKAVTEGQPVSWQFRKAVSGVADEIESLRAVLKKKRGSDRSAL